MALIKVVLQVKPRHRFELKLTQFQQASKVEPELGTAQPQLVIHIYIAH
jgi:hypothetical protein